ncbi:MAG: GWxTD domain-containing protein [Acidobacteriota bacterium]
MPLLPFFPVLAIFLALAADEPSLNRLFSRAKEEFRLGSYDKALQTLSRLEAESLEPGSKQLRPTLEAAVAFYEGACYAALGKGAEARSRFETYLASHPTAALDPAIYPKKVIAVFEEARKSLGHVEGRLEEKGSLALAYAAFPTPDHATEGSLGENWVEGPARFLMTPDERRDFTRLPDPVSRSEFITSFWKSRDPKPETPENEFREELEKRVAFADAHFTQGEIRGSLTDRGMVFVLLGPPTYVGRKPLTSGEDATDSSALFQYRPSDVRAASASGGTTSQRAARIDRVTGPGTKANDAASNWREVWHYRRELLPRGIPYLQVDFEFVTKRGYGENVLQRDTQALDTLERAKALLKKQG